MAVDTLTLAEIQARVNTVVRDPSKVFVTDENVKDWVNEAQLDLASRLRVFIVENTGTVGGDADIDLPADFLEVRRLRLGSGAPFNRVEMVSDDVFDSFVDRGATPKHTIGRFHAAYISQASPGAIDLHPAPSSGTAYELRYYRSPDLLTGAGDISPLPAVLHVRLVRYAQAQACIKIREIEQAASYMGLYEQGLPPSPGSVDPHYSVPKQMHYERGPFDHSEARHL